MKPAALVASAILVAGLTIAAAIMASHRYLIANEMYEIDIYDTWTGELSACSAYTQRLCAPVEARPAR